MKKAILGIAILGMLPACSSVIEGTSQEIMVNTNPSGADCSLMRQGNVIARVNPTPAAVTIKKTKYDITVVCNKDGFEEATYLNHSGAAGATFGNIVLGGGIGWAIDSASGADNKYDSPVNMTLVRDASVAEDEEAPKPNKKHRHIAAAQTKPKATEQVQEASPSAGSTETVPVAATVNATEEPAKWPSTARH
jgi:hypothetical protein